MCVVYIVQPLSLSVMIYYLSMQSDLELCPTSRGRPAAGCRPARAAAADAAAHGAAAGGGARRGGRGGHPLHAGAAHAQLRPGQ